jgi:hypothetical protein
LTNTVGDVKDLSYENNHTNGEHAMSDRLTDEQVAQIVEAFRGAGHSCRFEEVEARRVHLLADALDKDGMDNLRAVIDFGGKLRMISKFGWIAFITTVVGGIVWALWQGIVSAIRGQ